jgi:hypothetical protein
MPNCTACGGYAGDEKWRKLCRVCFAARKRDEQRELEDGLDYYSNRCAALEAQLRSKGAGISDEHLKRLIMLCHPDKHGNSKISNEITQWLLSLRK